MKEILLNAPFLSTAAKESWNDEYSYFLASQIAQFNDDISTVCEKLELVALYEILIISKMLDKISLSKLGGGE